MMKNKLAELSLTELQERKKKMRGVVIGLGSVMVIALGILLFLAIRSKNYVLIAIIPGCLMTLFPVFISLSQLNTEIKSRQSK